MSAATHARRDQRRLLQRKHGTTFQHFHQQALSLMHILYPRGENFNNPDW
jgi:hypothetical protein